MEESPPNLTGTTGVETCSILTNGKTSNNLRFIVRTQTLPSLCQHETVQWVMRCLEHKLLEHVKDQDDYPWRIVSNVVNELTEPKYADSAGVALDTPCYPEIVIAVHIYGHVNLIWNHVSDKNNLVVLNENPLCHNVSADIFEEIVLQVPPPPFVKEVGVSAVSDEFMMELWGEITGKTESSTLDVQGKGYMEHPMWRRFWPGGRWVFFKETSFSFGWKGYV